MIEDDRVESMAKPKKEEDKKEGIEEKKEEHNPKPKKKKVKKKVAKKTEEKKVEKQEKAVSMEEEQEKKEEIEEKTEEVEKEPEKKEETEEKKEEEPKKEKKKLGKIITTIVVLVIIIAIILFIAKLDFSEIVPKEEAPTKEGDVAAVINGEIITNEELDKQYAVLPAQYKLAFTKDAFLDQMIDEKLLLQEAKKEGIEVDEKRVDSVIDNMLLQSGLSLEEFEDRLEAQGISLDYIESYYKSQIVISDLLNNTVFSGVEVTLPERIKASHILVDSLEDAEKIKEELDNGADFAEIAKEKSTDLASGANGGDLGYFIKGQMVEEFEEAAFALDVDDISAIVETSFGYHIIKLVDKKPVETMLLSEVRVDEQNLVSEDMGGAITDYLDGLRSEAVITKGREGAEKVSREITTFKLTGDDICSEDGKPIIRLFSTTRCPHCKWIKDAFDNTVKGYGNEIVAYHWELDIGDNTLTAESEQAIPKGELDIFKKYNSRNTVPTFVFGCKYYRVGNAYEALDDLAAEEAEFMAVIEDLLSET